MDGAQQDRAAALLMEARRGSRLAALPDDCRPDNEADAYGIQDRYVALMLAEHGGHIVGYKAGCTNVTAQRQLGLSSPFAGPLCSFFVMTSPADISADAGFMRMIEAEIGFRLDRDLPDTGTPYTAESVRPALGTAFGAIEVVDSRYEDWTTAGAPQLIADNACTGFWLYGEESADFEPIDLTGHPVQVTRNGQRAEQGSSANVLGNPLNVAAWLANHLISRGDCLRSGQLITTGTMIAVNGAEKGDRIAADFGALGIVEVNVI
jgi:2-keto-4-pentenoate hydratase